MAIYANMLRLFRAQEGSGNTLVDTSGNALNGTADGTLVWVADGDLGTVPDLGGTIQVDCGDVAGADGATLTIAGWFKFAGAPAAIECIASKWTATGNQRSWNLARLADGDLRFQVTSAGVTTESVVVAEPLVAAGPYHLIIEFTATGCLMWIDLVPQTVLGTFTVTSIFAGTAPLFIGGHSAGGNTSPADIRFKDLAIWNRVITSDERQKAFDGEFWDYSIDADLAIAISLASDYEYLAPSILGKPAAGTFTFNVNAWGANSTPAPDSFFAIDEGTGTVLTNIGKDAGSYNGTIDGATWGTEFDSPILIFDGSNDFVSFAGSAFGITAFPCTIALVCRTLSDFTVFKGAFALAGAGASVNHVICITSLERIQIRTQNTTLFTSAATSGNLFDGSYHLLVMVLASDTSKIGYHGATITSPAITDNVAIGTLTAARLGSFADSTPSDFANIAVASAMVWKGVALSAAQIQTDLAGNPFGFLTPKITLAVADLASGFAVDSTALTQANTLSVAALDHAFALDAFALTQANTLAAADMAFGFALDNTVLIAAEISLTVAELVHALSLDNVALTQANTLAVSELLHAFTLDSLGGLTPFAKGKRRSQVFVGQPFMGPTIVPDDMGLDTRGQRGAVTGAFARGEAQEEEPEEFNLVVDEMVVALQFDALALTQANTLAVGDLAHAFSVDNVATTFSALLGVDDLLHAFVLDGADLTQAIGLTVQDLLHALIYTEPELDEASALVLSDALFNLLFDEITFSLVTDEPLPLGQQVVATVFKFREASTLFGVIDG